MYAFEKLPLDYFHYVRKHRQNVKYCNISLRAPMGARMITAVPAIPPALDARNVSGFSETCLFDIMLP